MFFLTLCALGIGGYLAGVRRMHAAGTAGRSLGRRAGWPGCWCSPRPPTSASPATRTCCSAPTWPSTWCCRWWCRSCWSAAHRSPSPCAPCADPTDPQVRGAREWLLIALHSRATRLLTHPLVALGIYMASLFGLYFSDLLGVLMRSHLGHLAMLTHFVIAGYLLFWVLIGIDPGRPTAPPPAAGDHPPGVDDGARLLRPGPHADHHRHRPRLVHRRPPRLGVVAAGRPEARRRHRLGVRRDPRRRRDDRPHSAVDPRRRARAGAASTGPPTGPRPPARRTTWPGTTRSSPRPGETGSDPRRAGPGGR